MQNKVPKNEIEQRMASFIEACRRRGLKVTHQRTEVYRELISTKEHPDVETVYERVRNRVPAMSLDTVYRTMALFESLRLARKVALLDGRTRYDGNVETHHHWVCTRCGVVRDFSDKRLDKALQLSDQIVSWGDIKNVQVHVNGVCTKCQDDQRDCTTNQKQEERT